jgi:hypothetical protein
MGASMILALAHATSSGKLSNAAIAAVVVAAIVVVCCLAWGIVRMTAFEPRWMQSLRHSLAEAGFRASATLAEFGDWARLGR